MPLMRCLAMLLLASCRATSVYEPPAIPSNARCYSLFFHEWSPGVARDGLAWFMPPETLADGSGRLRSEKVRETP